MFRLYNHKFLNSCLPEWPCVIVAAACELPPFKMRAIDRLLHARTLKATAPCITVRVRTRALGQSDRRVPPVPIRTPERSSRLSVRNVTYTHIAVRHALTRIFPPHLSACSYRAILIWGDRGMA